MKLFQQLVHGGPTSYTHDGTSPWAASPIADPVLGVPVRPKTKGMIDEVIEGFAAAALRVRSVGLDGVEVDTVVFMSGAVPDYDLIAELEGIPDLYIIGDAAGPRALEAAIAEGSLAASRTGSR